METAEQIDNWVSVRDAARISGYGMDWIRRLARYGEIKSTKMGFAVLIDRNSLEKYVEVHSIREE